MTSTYLYSASAEFLAAATAELKALYPHARTTEVGDDAGLLTCDGLTLANLAEACRETPVVFVRHLTQVGETIPLIDITDGLPKAVEQMDARVADWPKTTPLTLQVWAAEGGPVGQQTEIDRALRSHLTEAGYDVQRSASPLTLHLCVTRRGLIVGGGSTADTLADWPGGRVRLRRSPEEVSRAEHKLEEAIMVLGLPLPAGGVAVDLGASPGGWTQVLSRRGFEVHAVDPADLAPSVAADPNVTHERMTAGRFFAERKVGADVVVNDMRMEPLLSCDVMLQAARTLKRGGLAVVTLKIPESAPAKVVAMSLERLRRSYEILGARQLYHNRREVTVALRRG